MNKFKNSVKNCLLACVMLVVPLATTASAEDNKGPQRRAKEAGGWKLILGREIKHSDHGSFAAALVLDLAGGSGAISTANAQRFLEELFVKSVRVLGIEAVESALQHKGYIQQGIRDGRPLYVEFGILTYNHRNRYIGKVWNTHQPYIRYRYGKPGGSNSSVPLTQYFKVGQSYDGYWTRSLPVTYEITGQRNGELVGKIRFKSLNVVDDFRIAYHSQGILVQRYLGQNPGNHQWFFTSPRSFEGRLIGYGIANNSPNMVGAIRPR